MEQRRGGVRRFWQTGRVWAATATILLALSALLVGAPTTSVSADVAESAPGSGRGARAALATGGVHSCALLENNTVKCWGSGGSGRLGNNATTNIGDDPTRSVADSAPINLGTGLTATAITTGTSYTCALLDGGDIKCWGNGNLGRLGNNAITNIGDDPTRSIANSDPIDLGTGRTATAITTGNTHSCALLDNNTVKCWGNGNFGQLGNNATTNIGDDPTRSVANSDPIDLGTGRTATAISAGNGHTCALLDNYTVKCWGDGFFGQLGNDAITNIGDDPTRSVANSDPIDLGTGRTATAISAGNLHTCALLDGGDVKCWGLGSSGQLGNIANTGIGDGFDPSVADSDPIDLGTGRTATAITTGNGHTCALLDGGDVKCWGNGFSGRIGNNANSNIGDGQGTNPTVADSPPIDLGTGRTAKTVSAGDSHTCAVLDDNTIKCWGFGSSGQLGNNGTTNIGDDPARAVADNDPIGVPPLAVQPEPATPAPPTAVTANAGDQTVELAWSAPSDDGGAPITGYGVEQSTDNGLTWSPSAVTTSSNTATSATVTGLTNGTSYQFRVSAINAAGTSPPSFASAATTPTAPPPPPPPPPPAAEEMGIVTVAPGRLVETRTGLTTVDGQQNGIGRRAARQVTTVEVWGRADVPAGATAALVNIGAVNPQLRGFVTAFPCDADRPDASTLNYAAGQTISNGAVIALSAAGTLCVYTHRAMDLIVDVTGYTPAGSVVETNTPARLLETRAGRDTIDGESQGIGQRAARQVTEVQVTGRAGIDPTATAAILNIAAINPALQGFITVFPCDADRPEASTLNYAAGQTIANGGIFALSTTGTICIYTHRAMDLIVDVTGSLPDTDAVNPIVPARYLETRQGSPTFDGQSEGIGQRQARQVTTLQVAGRGDIPDDATSAILNIATINPALQGFITVYPCDVDQPEASTLNYQAGQTIANNAVIALSSEGTICIYTHRQMDLIVDITGWPSTPTEKPGNSGATRPKQRTETSDLRRAGAASSSTRLGTQASSPGRQPSLAFRDGDRCPAHSPRYATTPR
ncbi:MAG: fibronectin type III domain-containing protein [Actinomycetota bacterium]